MKQSAHSNYIYKDIVGRYLLESGTKGRRFRSARTFTQKLL